MRTLPKNRRSMRLAILGVLFLSLLVAPVPVNADGGWFDWVPDPVTIVLDLVLSSVASVNALLGQLLNMAKDLLRWVLTLSLQLILGLKVIDVAWNVMRDMANMVFILMLILISFSTIFNVVKGLQRFHYRTALMPLIIAALMMNFSLAIGKAGVLVFDQVARIFINIMPNLGADLTKSLSPQSIVLDPKALTGPLPSNADAARGVVGTLTAAEDKRLKECLNEERSIARGTGYQANNIYDWDVLFGDEPGRKGLGDCNLEIIAARQGAWKVAAGQITTPEQEAALKKLETSTPSNSQEQKIFLIFSGVISGFMILLLTLCLVSPCLFLLLRVLMLWVLLFSSPVAWASYAIPGSDFFKKWWSLFIGWNAFGPVYLFVLIPGMIILSRNGEMLTALGSSASSGITLGTASGLFQILMFNAFAILVFLGGLGVAMKSSFAGAVKGTAFLGDLAGKAGSFDSTGLGGARLVGRATGRAAGAVGRYTGASAYIEAGAERAKQAAAARLQQGRLGRAYQFVKPTSYEEKLAAARTRLGVTGGTAELNTLRAGQVKTQSDELDKQMLGMNSVRQSAFLRERMNSPDKALALAAREQLLKMGKLSQTEINDTRKMYPNGPARQEFLKRAGAAAQQVKRKAGAAIAAKKKEAKEARDDLVTEVSSKSYPDAAAVAAELGRLTDPDDIRAAQEAIGKKAPAQLLDHLTGGGAATPDQYRQAFETVLKDKDALMKLGPKYFDQTTPTSEFRDLQAAINTRYPKGAAVGTPAYLAREKYKDDLINSRPSMQAKIEDLFT